MGSAVPRDEIWLTTKIWPDKFRAGALLEAAEESVRRLGTEPDLLLLHWPNPDVPLDETVGALNEARTRGYTQHIGISNYPAALIREAVGHSTAPLLINQVEYHPYLDQSTVLAELARQGMALTAYSPVGRGTVFKDPTLQEIGAAHGKNAGQVTLRWLVQQGVSAIPRSTREANVAANLDIFDFTLSDEEMARISGLARPGGRMVKPAHEPDWD
jgi:diketogulonate reductase-like aldo/keto reductase